MSEPDLITMDDIRKAGHCARGARDWFERHDLDFRAFLKQGISVEKFLISGDALAQRVVELKRERERG